MRARVSHPGGQVSGQCYWEVSPSRCPGSIGVRISRGNAATRIRGYGRIILLPGSSLSLAHLGHPSGQLSDLEQIRRLIKEHGYVYLHDVRDDFDHVAFLKKFGDLLPQYDGQLVWE